MTCFQEKTNLSSGECGLYWGWDLGVIFSTKYKLPSLGCELFAVATFNAGIYGIFTLIFSPKLKTVFIFKITV